ncbi:DUF4232 domain-containing protein [Micromonospora krabiensis]|uniref:DUF4232 domain-containing protein n=1 Tax=Micromonospora krabiensis TaxID=307121 RepID=A0A1C3N9T9_9ACTN|nr:DUF4232 domain-containing protein [Micromonospora krabiensis]SBV29313.1 Protein of unknown function [Micromonospora krabiensis]
MSSPQARPAPTGRTPSADPTRPVGPPAVGAVLIGVALLLGACTSPTASGGAATGEPPEPSAPAATSAATCPASGVLIRSTGSDAAMGLRALGLELVNCGATPYRLNGYPAPTVRDEQRQPIPLAVVPGATGITSGYDAPPRALTLLPGDRAIASLLWRNTVTETTAAPAEGAYLDVAPGAGQPAQAVDPDGPIDVGTTGRIGVSAWKPAERRAPAPPPAPSVTGGPPSVAPTPDSRL